MSTTIQAKMLAPLKITCTSSSCSDGLHCFKQAKKGSEERVEGGICRDCGAALVDFPRIQNRRLEDVEYTVKSLKFEMIRHHFWHLAIDQRALNYARRKGKQGLRVAAERRIRSSVATTEPAFDGRQTPKAGNPLFYAQHATATCCRKCIEYWHGIERKRDLTDAEVHYFAALLTMFIDQRLPALNEIGVKVAPIRRSRRDNGSFFESGQE